MGQRVYAYDATNDTLTPVVAETTIQNSEGTTMPLRKKIKFVNATVTDDAVNDATVVTPSGGNLGDLAYKDSASGNFTPEGTISQQTVTVTGGQTDTVNSITAVGTLPSWTVTGETAVFNPGTLPTKGADQVVVSDTGTITVSQAQFTGTQGTVTVE